MTRAETALYTLEGFAIVAPMEHGPDDPAETSARQRLLDAGADLVRSLTAADVLPGVRSACRAAGVPTGSFYNCFADATEFHVALVERLMAHPPAEQRVDRSCDRAEEIVQTTSGAAIVAQVASNAGAGLTIILEQLRAATQAQQLLSAVADRDDVVAEAARRAYGERVLRTSARQEEAMAVLLEGLDCTIRPPFTVESVVTLLSAVSDGLVMRAQLEPGFDPMTLLEDTVRIVFVSLLCDNDDPADLDDVLATVAPGDEGPGPVAGPASRPARVA